MDSGDLTSFFAAVSMYIVLYVSLVEKEKGKIVVNKRNDQDYLIRSSLF